VTPRTETQTLIKAMRVLARDIHSDDGVANAAITEAANRLWEQSEEIRLLKARLESDAAIVEWKRQKQAETDSGQPRAKV
jgi:hypothetical protein